MKKLLTFLASLSLITTASSFVVSCGTFLDPTNPWNDGGDIMPPSDKTVDYDSTLEEMKISASTSEEWKSISKKYTSLYKQNKKEYKETQKEEIDTSDDEQVEMRKTCLAMSKVYWYWYQIIGKFSDLNAKLVENGLTSTSDWNIGKEKLSILKSIFFTSVSLRTTSLWFKNVYSGDFTTYILDSKEVDEESRKEDKKCWGNVASSINDYYLSSVNTYFSKAFSAIIKIDPLFSEELIEFNEYDDSMEAGTSQTLEITNISKFPNLLLYFDNENNKGIEITLDRSTSQILISVDDSIKSGTSFSFTLTNDNPVLEQEITIDID